MSRISPDVNHQDHDLFRKKMLYLWVNLPEGLPVNIPVNTSQGNNGGQSIRYFHGTEITGMPDFITGTAMSQDGLIKMTMRVG